MLRWTFLYINIFVQLCSMSLLCICYFLCQPYQGCISPTGVNLCLINVVYTASPWMPKTVGVFPGIPAVWVSLVKSLVSVLPKGGGICFIISIWEFFIASGCKSLVRDGLVVQRFPPGVWLVFILLPVSSQNKSFYVDEVQFMNFLFYGSCFWCQI